MNNEGFEAQVLSEKLSKLNNSQQSIESLSRWCISHRKKAKQIVETWDKLFNSSQKDQRVSFLYLANDILQNSRRKGSEFVNEFWKVLPVSLKNVYDHGDESGKKAVARLVDIWEERKVFGSRGQSLKDEMLGKNPPPLPNSNGKSSNPIKIVKRDAHSVRIKLAVGGVPEKILTAFQSVLDEHLNEDAALNNCSSATHHLNQIEEDLNASIAQGTQPRSALLDDLQEQENVVQQCIGQLESVEATRASLVSLLVEALQDQESKLELVRNQLQIARSQIELASNVRKRIASPVPGPLATNIDLLTEMTHVTDAKLPSAQSNTISSQSPLVQAMVSSAGPKSSEEENKRAAAAAVAAKLAASTSSAQMLTSVLSSLVAEEAASMNGGLKSAGFASLSIFSPEKRQKLEKPMPISDSSDGIGTSFVTPMQQQQLTNVALAQSANIQPVSQANQSQASFAPPPPPAPPVNQYAQSGGIMGVLPYNFGAYSLPPPPPLPPHIVMGLSRPTSQPPQQQPQQPQQSQPTSAGFYRPPGIGFYGQGQQSTPPPVPRQ
ncbi:Regulation of nuclear pre-mRNA domain-containing protein 1B, partial [Cucurbita argyrosperma subsp. sororia]